MKFSLSSKTLVFILFIFPCLKNLVAKLLFFFSNSNLFIIALIWFNLHKINNIQFLKYDRMPYLLHPVIL